MMHTIISLDDVFPSELPADIAIKRVDSGYAEYSGNKLRRLFSTNPADYLSDKYKKSLFFC